MTPNERQTDGAVRHTPGPWEVSPCGEYVIANGPDMDVPLDICTLTDLAESADAALIASAPELLAACQALVAHADKRRAVRQALNDTEEVYAEIHNTDEPTFVTMARAAIVKATGGAR